jgi:hypothetical protein
LPTTSKVIASLTPLDEGGRGNEISFVGIGPTRSQFPANGFTAAGVIPPPQPQSSKLIPQAVKLNKAQVFMSLKTLARAILRDYQKEKGR